MTEHTGRPWLNYLLGLLCAGAIVAAVLVVGPASGSTTAVTRTAKVAEGVVQSTVSGSGNLAPASQLNLGFKTGGTVMKIFVTQGEYVTEGKLIAELDPQSAEVTLEQAKASLLSAKATLAKEEETGGEGSGVARSETSQAKAASTQPARHTTPQASGPQTSTSQTSTSQTSTPQSSTSQSSTPTISAATREANLASARAAVKSQELTVRSDEEAVADTRLFAPRDGTIVRLCRARSGSGVGQRHDQGLRRLLGLERLQWFGQLERRRSGSRRVLGRGSLVLQRLGLQRLGLLIRLGLCGAQRPLLDAARGAAQRIGSRQRQGRADRDGHDRSARRQEVGRPRQRSGDALDQQQRRRQLRRHFTARPDGPPG